MPNIDALEQSIASFLSEVLVFYKEPIDEELIASLLDKIKQLQHSNCERVSVIKELAKAVHDLKDNAERKLLTAIDKKFYPKPTSRVFEYSAKEKKRCEQRGRWSKASVSQLRTICIQLLEQSWI